MTKASWVACGLLGLGVLATGACNNDVTTDGGSGGGTTGGSASGGKTNTSGGAASGGRASGGGAAGGAASGGAASGGAAVGGMGGATGGEGGSMAGSGQGGEPGCDLEALVPVPHSNCADIDVEELELPATPAAGFEISSPDFDYCEPIPKSATCDGREFAKGSSPKLAWKGKPAGTLSYALVFKDISILGDKNPDTERFGQHWVMWDIPASATGLDANLSADHVQGAGPIEGARQWATRNQYGFFGPCPNPFPPTDDRFTCSLTLDSYAFVLYALDVASLAIDQLPEHEADVPNYVMNMDKYLRENALAYAEYRGTSDAWSTAFNPPPANQFPCTETVTTDCLAGPQ